MVGVFHSPRFLSNFTGFQAFCALIVLFHHHGVGILPGMLDRLSFYGYPFLTFFFIKSGFFQAIFYLSNDGQTWNSKYSIPVLKGKNQSSFSKILTYNQRQFLYKKYLFEKIIKLYPLFLLTAIPGMYSEYSSSSNLYVFAGKLTLFLPGLQSWAGPLATVFSTNLWYVSVQWSFYVLFPLFTLLLSTTLSRFSYEPKKTVFMMILFSYGWQMFFPWIYGQIRPDNTSIWNIGSRTSLFYIRFLKYCPIFHFGSFFSGFAAGYAAKVWAHEFVSIFAVYRFIPDLLFVLQVLICIFVRKTYPIPFQHQGYTLPLLTLLMVSWYFDQTGPISIIFASFPFHLIGKSTYEFYVLQDLIFTWSYTFFQTFMTCSKYRPSPFCFWPFLFILFVLSWMIYTLFSLPLGNYLKKRLARFDIHSQSF